MKIGLIGAPGSGKTELARRLAVDLGLDVIDEYVPTLEQVSGYAFGRHATYVGNIHIGIARHHLDRRVDRRVTCGTMIDTVTYLAVKAKFGDHPGDSRRLTGGLVVLGCMVEDMMDYDHLFLLPSEPEDEFTSTLAKGLEEAVTVFGVSYTLLDQPTADERVAAVHAHIEEEGLREAPAAH